MEVRKMEIHTREMIKDEARKVTKQIL